MDFKVSQFLVIYKHKLYTVTHNLLKMLNLVKTSQIYYRRIDTKIVQTLEELAQKVHIPTSGILFTGSGD